MNKFNINIEMNLNKNKYNEYKSNFIINNHKFNETNF